VILLVVGGVGYGYYQTNYAAALNNITSQTAIHMNTTTNAPVNTDILNQRTNIVLLGSDTDGKGNDPTNGTPLAQTVIIITVDPLSHYVGMLSIPRDMQVSDPTSGFANEKLDEAFEHAWVGKDANERARTAAGHMMDVIEKNYGIHIDHYAWVGLQGFIKVIDTVDGVDVDVTHPIEDDLYPDDTNNPTGNAYDYKRLYLPPGPQHLDGPTALEYVRTRHADLGGDFGRTARQQQVLSQLKEKLSSANTISQAPQLLKDLDGFLMTDLSLPDLTSFAQIAKSIDTNKIQHVSLTPPMYAATGLPRNNFGPICDQVNQVVQQMFNTQPQCVPQTANTPNTPSDSHAVANMGLPAITTSSTASRQTQPVTTGQLSASGTHIMTPADIHNVFNLLLLTAFGSFDAVR
jgi:LCP family protein required for cell wall assembly